MTTNEKSPDLPVIGIWVTKNGEITQDESSKEYTVWDETYAYIVCKTMYEKVAYAAHKTYCEVYLDPFASCEHLLVRNE